MSAAWTEAGVFCPVFSQKPQSHRMRFSLILFNLLPMKLLKDNLQQKRNDGFIEVDQEVFRGRESHG
jgi:hypothetical protein